VDGTKGELNMSDFKFDGKMLRNRAGSRVAEIDGKYVRDSHGSRIGEFDGKTIRDGHGTRLAEFDGEVIRSSSGSRLATIADVRKAIDGAGGISLVALWLLVVR
jgi:hypothetical protein